MREVLIIVRSWRVLHAYGCTARLIDGNGAVALPITQPSYRPQLASTHQIAGQLGKEMLGLTAHCHIHESKRAMDGHTPRVGAVRAAEHNLDSGQALLEELRQCQRSDILAEHTRETATDGDEAAISSTNRARKDGTKAPHGLDLGQLFLVDTALAQECQVFAIVLPASCPNEVVRRRSRIESRSRQIGADNAAAEGALQVGCELFRQAIDADDHSVISRRCCLAGPHAMHAWLELEPGNDGSVHINDAPSRMLRKQDSAAGLATFPIAARSSAVHPDTVRALCYTLVRRGCHETAWHDVRDLWIVRARVFEDLMRAPAFFAGMPVLS